jgi:eukaryotic-like serine/threonine-protein kinase
MNHGGADRRIGMVIGDYVVTQKLAEGGMGAVYIAENLPTGLKQIVKFMLAEFVANPALRERFEREIRAAVRLKGKTNIVEIYSCNQRDGEMYMTMEYLQGETLQDHIQRCGKISLHHAFRLISQIIAALHELHEAGIIHRDLKPANIFVVPTDAEAYTVKLIDFGIIHDRHAVAAGGQKTQRGSLVGTPGYMALEQFGDAGNVTPAADIFALAVIIWEMFTGQLPWSAPNEFALYERQKAELPALPFGHHLPSGWEAIIRAALSPNPADRPPLHALLYALAREVPSQPPIPSGFDMVVRYAPRVLRNTPVEVETVRASDAHRAAAAYWGIQRATLTPQTGPHAPVSSSDSIPISVPGFTPQSVSVPTANARPVSPTPVAPHQTTLSAASGVSSPPSAAPHPAARRTGPAIVLASVGAVALIAFGIAMGVSSRSSSVDQTGGAVSPTTFDAGLQAVIPDEAESAPIAATVDAGIDTTVTAAPDASVAAPAFEAKTVSKPTRPSTTRKPTRTGSTARESGSSLDRGSGTRPPASGTVIDPDAVAE